jgi:recombination protein RecA
MAVEEGLVRKSGAWYTHDGDQLGQGKENARKYLKDNAGLTNDLERQLKEKKMAVAKTELAVVPVSIDDDEEMPEED